MTTFFIALGSFTLGFIVGMVILAYQVIKDFDEEWENDRK